MRLCRVIGNVVSTVKHPVYGGQILLVVQPIDEHGADIGTSFLAVDRVQAAFAYVRTGDALVMNISCVDAHRRVFDHREGVRTEPRLRVVTDEPGPAAPTVVRPARRGRAGRRTSGRGPRRA